MVVKIIKGVALFLIIVLAAYGVGLFIHAVIYPAPDYYARSGEVIGIYRNHDTVVWTDCAGNMWEFKGVEDWEVGDRIACIMYTMGTEEIWDDAIVSVRYEG